MSSIIAENVTVELPVYDSYHRSFKRTLLSAVGGVMDRDSYDRLTIRALDSVSLEIRDGDRVGLVGHNGAGKSTLLRVLAGICEPNKGRVKIDGHVSTLFSLNSVMDPELSGYENIDHAAVLLGIARSRRQALIADIEEFTQLGEFLQMPVRTYSAGMQVRLAFALQTAIDPDILLLDEAIGAGDARFVHRAMERAVQIRDRTTILVIASHAEGHIRQMCNKVVWLEHGKVRKVGPVDEVLAEYHASLLQPPVAAPPPVPEPPVTAPSAEIPAAPKPFVPPVPRATGGQGRRIYTIADRGYFPMVRRLVASLARIMPQAMVTVCHDGSELFDQLAVPGQVECVELPSIATLGVKRAKFDLYEMAARGGDFLYLDADVVVLDDLSGLFGHKTIAACGDDLSQCAFVTDKDRPWPCLPDLAAKTYFNSGVMFFPASAAGSLAKMRADAHDDEIWNSLILPNFLYDNHFICGWISRHDVPVTLLDGRRYNWQGLVAGQELQCRRDGDWLVNRQDPGIRLHLAHFAGIPDPVAFLAKQGGGEAALIAGLADDGQGDPVLTRVALGLPAPVHEEVISDPAYTVALRRPPRGVLPGRWFNLEIELTNRGAKPWPAVPSPNSVMVGYHWRNSAGEMVVFEGARTPLPRRVEPGESVAVTMRIGGPPEFGAWTLEIDLLQEHFAWFGRVDPSLPHAVAVEVPDTSVTGPEMAAPPMVERGLFPVWRSGRGECGIDTATFICGCGHSGTTLLANMIAANPAIHIPLVETGMFMNPATAGSTFLSYLAEASQSGKRHFFEKSPLHVRAIPVIRALVRGAKFVVLVRDGRDVTASIAKRLGQVKPGLNRWLMDTSISHAERFSPDVLVLRYEDLIAAPAAELARVCKFAGVPYDEAMLSYHSTTRLWFNERDVRKGTGEEGEEHRALRNWQVNQPIFDGRGRYRSELSEADLGWFNVGAAQVLMKAFGYD